MTQFEVKPVIRILLVVALVGSSALYAWILVPSRFGAYHDDGIYVATAESLATGQGYRIISLPYEPAQTKYPPFYPFLLSLIWKAYPEFPENVPFMMVLSVIATLTSLLMAWKYLLRSEYATPWQALIVIAMTGLNWRTMILATSVYSEMTYTALSIAALFLAEKYETEARTWVPGLILGCLIGLAFLTRSTGIALPIAIAGYFVVRKKWRRGLLPLGVAGLFVLGWVAWCQVNKTTVEGENVAYYTSYLGHLNQMVTGLQEQSGSSRLEIFLNLALQNFIGGILIAVPLVSSGFGYNTLAGFSGLLLIVCVCGLCLILILVVAGFLRTLAKGIRLIHFYVIVCLGLQLFWLPNISHDRFLMPLLPLLLLFLVSEFWRLASMARDGWLSTSPSQKISGGLIAVVLIAVAGVVAYGCSSGAYTSLASLRTSAARASDDALAIEWIKEHTDPSETLVCYRDPKYFLYTGHKAVRSFPMTEGYSWEEDQASMNKLAQAVFRIIDEAAARYVVVTSTDFELEDRPEQHRKTFDTLIEQHPQNFTLVFESTDRRSRIYRIDVSEK